MDIPFLIIGLITAASAAGAVSLRKPIHCGLCAALAFLATGALYLYLNAEYLGLVQLLVYVGAVAVLILFTILLTRPAPRWDVPPPLRRASFWQGAFIALTATGLLAAAIVAYQPAAPPLPAEPLSIHALGVELTSHYMHPLLLVGLLLTAALIGAVLLAAAEEDEKEQP